MKVLHVNEVYGHGGGGGTEQTVSDTCRLLEERGHRTAVLYSWDSGNADDVPGRELCGIPGVCEFRLRPRPALLASALAFVERIQPDVIHVHQANDPYLLSALTQRWPVLHFVHNHVLTCPSGTHLYRRTGEVCTRQPGPLCLISAYTKRCNSRRPERLLWSYARCFSARHCARRAMLLAVHSQFMKNSLVASGFPASKITVIPAMTVLPELPQPLPPADPGLILYVGRIVPEKGLLVLLQALRRLRVQDWRLTVAGTGYLEKRARDLVRRLGLERQVEFRGWLGQAELSDLYFRASVVAAPTIWPEPYGLIGPEAMVYARPLVAFGVGGIPEWLHDGVNGFLVRPGDIAGFAAALDRVLADPAAARQMGLAGRELAIHNFNPSDHIDTLERLYRRAQALFRAG